MSDKMQKYINFFDEYTKYYIDIANDNFQRININRKIEHSKRVNRYAVEIAKKLNVNSHQLYLVNVASLFHDIGRFRQFYEYNTFIDQKSFNHGQEGANILEKESILNDLSQVDKTMVIEIVRLHNYISLPTELSPELRLLVSIIRDADKLDWMYAMVNIIPSLPKETQAVFYSNKIDSDKISTEMVEAVLKNERIRKRELSTVGELKIWTIAAMLTEYECKPSIQLILENDLINKVDKIIKCSEEKEIIMRYVKNQINSIIKNES